MKYMENKTKLLKKQDLILIVIILVVAAALGGWYYFSHQGPARTATVSVGGKEVQTINLDKDQEVTIESYNGGTNHLTVKDGEIWCDDASCPDKVCEYQGKQSLDGSMIVCLPNAMIVVISEKE
jgi:hypothetical protein